MAPPVGVKLTQLERTTRMLRRMRLAFIQHFPRCEVKVAVVGGDLACLQIDKVVRFILVENLETKIYALDDDNNALFLFSNWPKDGDLDRRMKSHDRMWRLFMASEIGQEKMKAWNALPVQTRVRMPAQMPTGFPVLDKVLEGGLHSGNMVAFAVLRQRVSRSYNCLVIGEHDRIVSRAIASLIGSRFVNRENVILFTLDPLATRVDLELYGKRVKASGMYTFTKVSTLEELVEMVERVRADEGFGQRLHLIIDAPSLVEYSEPNRELDHCMLSLPFRFRNEDVKQIAEQVEVLTVVVKAPE